MGRYSFEDWNLLFGIILDTIWYHRNNRNFNGFLFSVVGSVREIWSMFNLIKQAWVIETPLQRLRGMPLRDGIRWEAPPQGYVKCNTDGSVNQGQASDVAGGIIRDEAGNFVVAFSNHLGLCSVLHAELWGALLGMKLALARGIRKVVVELDSMVAVLLIQ
ncbi:hypothetical protein RIF29_29844 [Crotalaria pallida]|uniref:RNase H type-1 domain-containing protein n=1 Tax=Crotalaria pallida TaxID=3830 RepID=A0AAN9EHE6_CROPI